MKDLEKIKSEDLACQVADANPANFAIEQEVAQLVGATVPQPTQPSADDARELPAQLLVFLRRALTPIQSALRTAVADIYAHLDSRCTDYTPAAYAPFRLPAGPYDPMRPFVPRTLPNLLTALTAFAPRKISNGSAPSDGIPDGESLAQLVCAGAAIDAVTEIKDDNHGWIMTRALPYKNAKKVSLGCSQMQFYFTGYGTNAGPIFNAFNEMEELDTFDMTEIRDTYGGGQQMTIASNCPKLKKWNAPKFGKWNFSYVVHNCPNLETVIWGTPQNDFNSAYSTYANNFTGSNSKMVHFEICADGGLLNRSFHLDWWNPSYVLSDNPTGTDLIEQGSTAENNLDQFLLNFKNYIALRLTANGTGKTLTLSQAVFSAVIEGSSPICDDIKGIIEDKGWKVQDTNNNIFPTT